MGATITTRVSDEIAKTIRYISRIEHLDRSATIRRLLAKSVRGWKIDHALKEYEEGKITLWKAARLSDVSLREMMTIAAKRGVPFQYSLEDLKRDYKAAKK